MSKKKGKAGKPAAAGRATAAEAKKPEAAEAKKAKAPKAEHAAVDMEGEQDAQLNTIERKHEGLEREHNVLTREHRVHHGGKGP